MKVKLPGDRKERSDAKAIAGLGVERSKQAFRALYRAVVKIETGRAMPTSDDEDVMENFAVEMAQAMTIADTYGRARTLHEMRLRAPDVAGDHSKQFRALIEGNYAAVFAGIDDVLEDLHVDAYDLPEPPADTPESLAGWMELPFDEAVSTILEREPELAQGFIAAANAYNHHGFALARATSINIAREVQAALTSGLREGRSPEAVARDLVDKDDGFDDAYMRVVAMTNFASAYSAGRERQMRAPEVAGAVLAHVVKSALLPTTRPNHRACHNFVASPDDQLWHSLSPLLGYNCYCRKRPIFRAEAAQLGLVLDRNGNLPAATRPDGAEPDSNAFGKRSDLRFYDSGGGVIR